MLRSAASKTPGLDEETLNEGLAYAYSPGLIYDQAPDQLLRTAADCLARKSSLNDSYTRFNLYGLALRPLLRRALASPNQTLETLLPHATDVWLSLEKLEKARIQSQLEGQELARLRKEGGELLGLRGEIGRLRNQMQRVESAPKENPATTGDGSRKPYAFSTFETTVQSRLLVGQTLMAGGWPARHGKRSLFLVTPQVAESGQEAIHLETKLFEVSEGSMGALTLGAVNSEAGTPLPGRILNSAETESSHGA